MEDMIVIEEGDGWGVTLGRSVWPDVRGVYVSVNVHGRSKLVR